MDKKTYECSVCGGEFEEGGGLAYCSKECSDVAEEGYNQAVDQIIEHTYGAFQDICSEIGASGFQASIALMQILWRGNGWKGPGMVIRAENMLYPQYERPTEKAVGFEYSDEVLDWLRDEARRKLTEHGYMRDGVLLDEGPKDRPVHRNVLEHWKQLAGVSA